MRRPTIIDSSGESRKEFSTYCPNCGCHKIRKDELTGPGFDENGWHYIQNFQCLDPKCNYGWAEKIIVMGGGIAIRYNA